MNDLVMTFYGDDFTGSTDAMEQLVLGGVPTVLFLDIPTDEQLTRFPDVRAIGIAGVSRSMSPEQMDTELPPRFKALAAMNAPFFHYKVCSTFDSSPTVGSIGRATDIGWEIFEPSFVPLVVGAPFIRRYMVFGNLFARVGDVTYRLDRHPTMSKHPITPMNEGDLRLHLSKQTSRKIGTVDVWHMTWSEEELDTYVQSLIDSGHEIISFDTFDDHHLAIVGRMLWKQQGDKPVFIVGSSGVEAALTSHLRSIDAAIEMPLLEVEPVDQLLVMSGSAAPGTGNQIEWALSNGYEGIRLDTVRLVDPQTADAERESTIAAALAKLDSGASVVLYSTVGPDDPVLEKTKTRINELGLEQSALAKQQGRILRELLEKSDLRRACVAGGDTSGHSSHQLGIFALQMAQQIAPGAPLCRAYSSDPQFDGLEISLKGGQNGDVDYFEAIRQGSIQDNRL